MTTPPKDTVTDPKSYTDRDLLLLTQLLHTAGLIAPEDVRASNLDDFGEKWFQHKSTALARQLEEFPLSNAPSGLQVRELYNAMLEQYPNCKNTTDLANTFYFQRIRDLESKIADSKAEFQALLGE
ncbi:hypothetical protein CLUG_00714 [Clavispora lusitaniae ATCC 42720]|uniref:Uncharacterized protein n=1 Tax=Clavispora lusitaniae (strain ATCC 42720) TaxID=306902 RepID=C4XXP2_CLAL4|nr:uncharacterized protein CLUG_00714 [Clavispora lusitaniae ATCC 42720]EEQ36591.1 hypothetical protein CLUG_00714 [Clavispora lusitaniae ATCC 42720]KAF5212945.1 hypothetical protein E0198_000457 [Clavispora lusitaniae]